MNSNVVALDSQEPRTSNTAKMLALIARPEGVTRSELKKLGLDKYNFKAVLKRHGYELRTKGGHGQTHYWAIKPNIKFRENVVPVEQAPAHPAAKTLIETLHKHIEALESLRKHVEALEDALAIARKYIAMLEKNQ